MYHNPQGNNAFSACTFKIMASGSHKRLTALLGLIAMWLVVVAPTVNRLVYASHDLVVPICSVVAGTQQHSVSVYRIHLGGQNDSPASPLNVCGYCNLSVHSTVMPSVPPAAPAVLLLALILLIAPRHTRFTPCGVFPSGRPRDPPHLF